MGPFHYAGRELDFWFSPEGRILNENTAYTYAYVLGDHLGNTRATFMEDGGRALLTQSNHYYPFGLEIAALNHQASPGEGYDYLYNGKEKQRFNGLDWYDFGARFYDASLGRFFRIDRFAEKYPTHSPYHYTKNSPLYFTDVNGDTLDVNKDGATLTYRDGHYYDSDGNQVSNDKGKIKDKSYTGRQRRFFNRVSSDLQTIESGARGSQLVDGIVESETTITIKDARDETPDNPKNNFNNSDGGAIVLYNPDREIGGLDANGNTLAPSFTGLAHELAHAEDFINGTMLNINFNYQGVPGFENGLSMNLSEWYAVGVENQIRAEHNIAQRTHYDTGGFISMSPSNTQFTRIMARYFSHQYSLHLDRLLNESNKGPIYIPGVPDK